MFNFSCIWEGGRFILCSINLIILLLLYILRVMYLFIYYLTCTVYSQISPAVMFYESSIDLLFPVSSTGIFFADVVLTRHDMKKSLQCPIFVHDTNDLQLIEPINKGSVGKRDLFAARCFIFIFVIIIIFYLMPIHFLYLFLSA